MLVHSRLGCISLSLSADLGVMYMKMKRRQKKGRECECGCAMSNELCAKIDESMKRMKFCILYYGKNCMK